MSRQDLHADCSNCFALCCVALPFAASADFAVDKPAGKPCGNLLADYRCGIHTELRNEGFRGCTVFDCFGAGQKVSQHTFQGRSWREDRATARLMFDVFPVMRQLQEFLWYLAETLDRPEAETVHAEARDAAREIGELTRATPEALLKADVTAVRAGVNEILLRTGDLVRAALPGRKKNHRGADLMGSRLRNAKLRGANLRGAYLIAADLSGADLRDAEMIGADLRDTNVAGADLTGALFLTQAQVSAARGDATTKISPVLTRPAHW